VPTPEDTSGKLTVWMDGSCMLCQKSQGWCELRDLNRRLRFKDFRTANEDELPLARSDHEQSMWVRDPDGEVFGGFAAWRRIMAEIPRWRWLARMASFPPFNLVGPPVYRFIAARRSSPGNPVSGQGRHSPTGTG
jgi:predicted DCC family thiol-disulfide oxidoreductase YuxK